MLRKILSAVASGVILSLVLAPFSLAAAPNTPTTVLMQGQAAVVGSRQSPQLRLKAGTGASDGWLIEVSLNPTGVQSGEDGDYRNSQTVNLSGSFTLGVPLHPLAMGTATGWVGSTSGEIKLTDIQGWTSLDMPFTISADGSFTARVQGQWPVLPTNQGTPQPTQPAAPANHFWWYLSRTSAMVAYVLFFLNICLGFGLKSKYLEGKIGRWLAFDLHQFTALVAIALIGMHMFSLLGTTKPGFGLADLLFPGISTYRALWTALGVIGFYVVLAVGLSCYIRKLIGQRTWRVIHSTSFILFVIILLHSMMTGTDTSTLWARLLYVVTGMAAVFLFLWRFSGSDAETTFVTEGKEPVA